MVEHGQRQLNAVLTALDREMPAGTQFSRPDGGMNLWITLPSPLDAEALLVEAAKLGVTYLPAKYFAISAANPRSFRLSFGGLTPERIAQGVAMLGRVFSAEPSRARINEFQTAMV